MRVIALVLAVSAVALGRPQFQLSARGHEALQLALNGGRPVAISSGQLLFSAVDDGSGLRAVELGRALETPAGAGIGDNLIRTDPTSDLGAGINEVAQGVLDVGQGALEFSGDIVEGLGALAEGALQGIADIAGIADVRSPDATLRSAVAETPAVIIVDEADAPPANDLAQGLNDFGQGVLEFGLGIRDFLSEGVGTVGQIAEDTLQGVADITGIADIPADNTLRAAEVPAPVVAAPFEAAPVAAAPVEAAPVLGVPLDNSVVAADQVFRSAVEVAPIEAGPLDISPLEAAPLEFAGVAEVADTPDASGRTIILVAEPELVMTITEEPRTAASTSAPTTAAPTTAASTSATGVPLNEVAEPVPVIVVEETAKAISPEAPAINLVESLAPVTVEEPAPVVNEELAPAAAEAPVAVETPAAFEAPAPVANEEPVPAVAEEPAPSAVESPAPVAVEEPVASGRTILVVAEPEAAIDITKSLEPTFPASPSSPAPTIALVTEAASTSAPVAKESESTVASAVPESAPAAPEEAVAAPATPEEPAAPEEAIVAPAAPGVPLTLLTGSTIDQTQNEIVPSANNLAARTGLAAVEDTAAVAPIAPVEEFVAPAAPEAVGVSLAAVTRRKRQLEEEEPISNARAIGSGLGSLGGLFGSTVGRFMDSVASATVEMVDGLEGLGTLAVTQVENSFDDNPDNDFFRR